jgi:hypothetical protein
VLFSIVRGRREKGKGKEKRRTKMEGTVVAALAVTVPIILFPAAFVWYLQIGGAVTAAREARARKLTGKVEAR